MKKIFMLVTLVAFIASTTCAFAKPKDKKLKLNRGQVQSSSNKLEKLTDSGDEKGKRKSDKKKEEKEKDSKLEKSVKKESKKALK